MAPRLTGFFDQPEAMLNPERPTGLRRLIAPLLSLPALAKMASF